MAIPGDLVRHDGEEKVVIDVADGWATLRDRGDLDGLRIVAVQADDLEVVGHVEAVPGWIEDEPGVWRPSPFGRPA